ncbi:uncharacterized protein LOC143433582 [Xylocopa sonorina]|uniref:uncharacterized protein LOC143433582 n=1 Tax=Xylocopa sonorina TaxID=1818115 RepID=UPI00403B2D03
MSERKVDTEIARKQYINDASLIDQAEIIDVSTFNFDDTDGWLCVPTEYQSESTVQDLYTWLRSEPELTFSVNRKSTDTRTFTRPKKRSNRCSFESILESLSAPVSNTFKTSNFSNIREDLNKYQDMSTANKGEIVPAMLKMTPIANNISFLGDEGLIASGQESMEMFLNMSQSKGIDSFINLMEPGLSDPLMNVSQPSIFYSSITSLPRDDSLHNAECDKDEEIANVTQLRGEEIGKYEDVKYFNHNDTICKSNESQDNNESHSLSPTNKTLTNDFNKINGTYNADTSSGTCVSLSSNNDKSSTTKLSSTYVHKDNDDTNTLRSENDKKEETFNLNTMHHPTVQKAENLLNLNDTYCSTEIEKPDNVRASTTKNDAQDKDQTYELEKTAVHDTHKNSPFSLVHDDALNSTFKLPIPLCNQSTPKSIPALNSTFRAGSRHLESPRVYSTTINSNFKAPTLLRKELLAEIYKSGEHRLDSTYNHVQPKEHQNERVKDEIANESPGRITNKNDIPVENKYNTYKKESSINKIKPRAEIGDEVKGCTENSSDKKYYTFTKKSSNHGGKTDMENAESLDNVDSMFVKPLPKLQKRNQHIPRVLSKLPQFLQKSNPNLVSNSLRTVSITGGANAVGFGYMKGSQPNIVRDVEKSLASKLYPLGKVKSGSEQRLLELNAGMGELQLLGAGGSTESIESTQSAHSAPDLDDRLSTCSDSSHNSYTTPPMNIEQLRQIVRMQEESLNQEDTPGSNKRILENTWIDGEKDLPSPIPKNGCDRDSPLSMNYNIKTSSPLISPTRSSQSINTDGHPMETVLKQNGADMTKKIEVFNKPVMKIENKTRLRQPTNWNRGIRAPNVTSAIPRPPSRIPGPRFVRPTVKNIQSDAKRGHM